jgi:hypothetical protein
LASKKQAGALILLKALGGWGPGGFFQKTTALLSLMTTYKMSQISAGAISLFSTYKRAGSVFYGIRSRDFSQLWLRLVKCHGFQSERSL